MASNPPEKCCTVGVRHSGEPTGRFIKVEEKYDAYIAIPDEGKAHKDAAILYMPDLIGIWRNSKLLADQFAASGYTCLVIDPFGGDKFPDPCPAGFDILKWIEEGSDGKSPHNTKVVDPIAVAGIRTLKEAYGAKRVGAVGYCFGAKYVVRHYKSGIDVGYVAHPSLVEEEELAAVTGPLSIAAAETDVVFTKELRHKSEDILKSVGTPYQINLYSGVEHGFSVRCDLSIRSARFAKEQAFYQAVAWFDQWLLPSKA